MYSMAKQSQHPLSRAIVAYFEENKKMDSALQLENVKETPGIGCSSNVQWQKPIH